ncbi:MAG: CBS domain-containing protein, partial [Planctomycetota bacterium]|nr:CBS domain-containing protein [Planctomycetota bacterium]
GALRGAEAQIIQNMLRLNEIHVEEIMTPRTVVFMVQKDSTVKEVVDTPEFKQFTRIPLYDKSPDDLAGWVLKADLYEALRNGEGEKKVSALKRTLHAVPEVAPLLRVLEEFARRSTHIFQVVDEYGGTAGILTLEDVVESVIGREIMDETDAVADLRRLAQPK